MTNEELIRKARSSLKELEGVGRLSDAQLLEIIRICGEELAAATVHIITNELLLRKQDAVEGKLSSKDVVRQIEDAFELDMCLDVHPLEEGAACLDKIGSILQLWNRIT